MSKEEKAITTTLDELEWEVTWLSQAVETLKVYRLVSEYRRERKKQERP